MRGKGIFIVLLLVFASFGVLAAENITHEFGAIKGTLDQKTENIFEREINFPDSISPATNLIFGENVKLENLIILIGIWIALFIIVRVAVGLVPLFEGDKVELLASLAVTVLIIITGVVEYLKYQYLNFLYSLKWMDALGPFKIFVGLAIVGAIAYGVYKLNEIYERKLTLEKGDVAAENLNTAISMSKIMAKSMD